MKKVVKSGRDTVVLTPAPAELVLPMENGVLRQRTAFTISHQIGPISVLMFPPPSIRSK